MVFIKAEVESSNDLDRIVSVIGARQVTSQDIKQVCLHNRTKSALPLKYAISRIQDFDATSMVKDIVEAILDQPYRGPMLR